VTGSERIVIADDSRTAVTVLAFALAREGYEVVTATDGVEALERIRETLPRLVILDGMMPRKDGFTVAAEIRGDSSIDPQPHIIMVTAEGRDDDRDRAVGAGVDDFLTKPFSPSQLLQRVRAALPG
jgi:DNA-binding response OmpR family regulator